MVYLKNNPLQTFQAASFGVSQTQVSHLIRDLNNLLAKTLKLMGLSPASSNEQLQIYLETHQISQIYQDATEQKIARKVDLEAQKQDYSGKKSPYGEEHCHLFKTAVCVLSFAKL